MRILLVEDDAGASRFIRKGLHEEGYTVDVAFDSARKACIWRRRRIMISSSWT